VRRDRGGPASAHRSPRTSSRVSKAKIFFTVDAHLPVRLVDVVERNGRARFGQPVAAVLGPLDEGDGAVEVRLEVGPLLRIDAGDAVQVEVRNRAPAPRSGGRS